MEPPHLFVHFLENSLLIAARNSQFPTQNLQLSTRCPAEPSTAAHLQRSPPSTAPRTASRASCRWPAPGAAGPRWIQGRRWWSNGCPSQGGECMVMGWCWMLPVYWNSYFFLNFKKNEVWTELFWWWRWWMINEHGWWFMDGWSVDALLMAD